MLVSSRHPVTVLEHVTCGEQANKGFAGEHNIADIDCVAQRVLSHAAGVPSALTDESAL